MSAVLVQLRDAIKSAIDAAKTANSFVDGSATFNSFAVGVSWLPLSQLEDFPATGKVWLIGKASDIGPNLGRSNRPTQMSLPIQLAVQWKVNPADPGFNTLIDNLVWLDEQLRDTIRLFNPDLWQWQRSEGMKDENSVPFNYTGLREGGFFEVYSHNYFLVTVT